jgi:hypothetical protein
MKRQITIYLPQPLLTEVAVEAKRLERTTAWLLIHAWQLVKQRLSEHPVPLEAY